METMLECSLGDLDWMMVYLQSTLTENKKTAEIITKKWEVGHCSLKQQIKSIELLKKGGISHKEQLFLFARVCVQILPCNLKSVRLIVC